MVRLYLISNTGERPPKALAHTAPHSRGQDAVTASSAGRPQLRLVSSTGRELRSRDARAERMSASHSQPWMSVLAGTIALSISLAVAVFGYDRGGISTPTTIAPQAPGPSLSPSGLRFPGTGGAIGTVVIPDGK